MLSLSSVACMIPGTMSDGAMLAIERFLVLAEFTEGVTFCGDESGSCWSALSRLLAMVGLEAAKFAASGVSSGVSSVASDLSRDFMVITLVCEIASVSTERPDPGTPDLYRLRRDHATFTVLAFLLRSISTFGPPVSPTRSSAIRMSWLETQYLGYLGCLEKFSYALSLALGRNHPEVSKIGRKFCSRRIGSLATND